MHIYAHAHTGTFPSKMSLCSSTTRVATTCKSSQPTRSCLEAALLADSLWPVLRTLKSFMVTYTIW